MSEPTLNATVLARLFEIEEQVSANGWDVGSGMWLLHQDDTETLAELAPQKIGGPGYVQMHPLEMLGGLSYTPPECAQGLVITWEAWVAPNKHDGVRPQDDPDRKDVRYVLAALRTGVWVLVRHINGERPKGSILDGHRLVTQPEVTEIGLALMGVFSLPEVPAMPPPAALFGLLQALGLNVEGIMIFGEDPDGE